MVVTTTRHDLDAESYEQAQDWMRSLVRRLRKDPPKGYHALRRTDPAIGYAAYEPLRGKAPGTRAQEHVAACVALRVYDVPGGDWRSADLPEPIVRMAERFGEEREIVVAAVVSGRSSPPFLAYDDVDDLFVVALDPAMQRKLPQATSLSPESWSMTSMGNGSVLVFPKETAWRFQAAMESKPRLAAAPGVMERFQAALRAHPKPEGSSQAPREGVVVLDGGDVWRIAFAFRQSLVDAMRSLGSDNARFTRTTKEWVVSKSVQGALLEDPFPEDFRLAVAKAIGQRLEGEGPRFV